MQQCRGPCQNPALTRVPPTRLSDLLRSAVREAVCANLSSRDRFPDAVFAIKAEMSIATYCQRIAAPTFWGGEAELIVLSTLLRQPVTVYLPTGGGLSAGYTPLVTYGDKFSKTKAGAARRPLRLLYSNGNQLRRAVCCARGAARRAGCVFACLRGALTRARRFECVFAPFFAAQLRLAALSWRVDAARCHTARVRLVCVCVCVLYTSQKRMCAAAAAPRSVCRPASKSPPLPRARVSL